VKTQTKKRPAPKNRTKEMKRLVARAKELAKATKTAKGKFPCFLFIAEDIGDKYDGFTSGNISPSLAVMAVTRFARQ
jgi:hypothetical protein